MARTYCLYDKRKHKVYMGDNLTEIARQVGVTYMCMYYHLKNRNTYANKKYAIMAIDKKDYIKKSGNNKIGMAENLTPKRSKKLVYFRDEV